ncbi:uncharacterized protein LOC110731889 [Chenopodium quinoa]|uniref:uncharacterized protein LOC110731889 n=1 Tax=Chenopodium quinoa TaxID=63459 RepID=UPI000B78E8BB|nr:uncharacterized protein LOC110731889 [Chenopodium quinoa]
MALNPCIVVHHGGQWLVRGDMYYSGGRVNVFEDIPECVDSDYVKNIIEFLEHDDIVKMHYLDPRKTMVDGIRFLAFDSKTFDPFLSLLLEFKVIHIYTEHELGATLHTTGMGLGHGSFTDLLTGGGVGCSAPRDNEDVGVDVDYDSEGTDEDDDELLNSRSKVSQHKLEEKSYEEEMDMLKRVAESKDGEADFIANDWEGESDVDSPSENEDDDDFGYLMPQGEKRQRAIESDNTKSNFFIGQKFENAVNFRKALAKYTIECGRNLHFYRNDPNRVGAKCRNFAKGCPWKIWASFEQVKRNFQVKLHNGEHTYGRSMQIKRMNSKWIAEYFANRFRVNPYMKVHDIIQTLWLEKGLKVSTLMAYRARKKGQANIVGEYEEQYSLLPRYVAEIRRCNSGNIVKLQLNDHVFERLYICFEALRKGFLAGCRPFISLDGCFLKGSFGGQLLVAVGRDGNNQMFPIAWAVVEVEKTDTWTWFLSLLADDLGTQQGAGYTFMLDQQKGLLAAVAAVFPEAETRVCARHVYCNFRTVFGGGLEYRKQYWIIAKSNTENDFKANIDQMRAISEDAAEDLLNRNYKKWCRAFYTPMSCCHSVDNNMSEVFNAYILTSRHKPIITMLEDIREGLMERLHKKRDEKGNKDILLCPRIQKTLERNKIWARGWNAFWDGGFCYGVRQGATQDKFVVNLQHRTLDEPEHYVNEYFTKQTYLKAYEYLLEPLNGPQEWPEADGVVIAPKLKKIQGRPKKNRRYQVGEVTITGRLRKTGTAMKCSLCGVTGHNKRGCKNSGQERQQNTHNQPSASEQEASTTPTVPMHMRGVGVYTYPNGYQRVATPANFQAHPPPFAQAAPPRQQV